MPTIHKASLGSQGRVIRGTQITEEQAVAERKAGRDIVVCGLDGKANRRLAQRIENGVGPNVHADPHLSAGRYALPHYQPNPCPPDGHSFHETDKRKAAKNP